MTGCGSPVALQFNVKVAPVAADTFLGGLKVNTGGEPTIKRVLPSAFPKRLTAEQKYALESHLRTSVIFKTLLL